MAGTAHKTTRHLNNQHHKMTHTHIHIRACSLLLSLARAFLGSLADASCACLPHRGVRGRVSAGKQLCSSALDGQLFFWSATDGVLQARTQLRTLHCLPRLIVSLMRVLLLCLSKRSHAQTHRVALRTGMKQPCALAHSHSHSPSHLHSLSPHVRVHSLLIPPFPPLLLSSSPLRARSRAAATSRAGARAGTAAPQ